jgi:hypothetical protein
MAKPEIINKLFDFGKNMFLHLRCDNAMLNDIEYLKEFNKYDRCLSEHQAVYSSEMQICNYIYYNIPNSINIRFDYTDYEQRYLENAYLDVRIIR